MVQFEPAHIPMGHTKWDLKKDQTLKSLVKLKNRAPRIQNKKPIYGGSIPFYG
jgi:hypothetical protein